MKKLVILLGAFALIGCGEKNSTGDNRDTGNGKDAADPVESKSGGTPASPASRLIGYWRGDAESTFKEWEENPPSQDFDTAFWKESFADTEEHTLEFLANGKVIGHSHDGEWSGSYAIKAGDNDSEDLGVEVDFGVQSELFFTASRNTLTLKPDLQLPLERRGPPLVLIRIDEMEAKERIEKLIGLVKMYDYETTNREVTITFCDKAASGELVIPDTIGGNPVTIIGEIAFAECTSLTNITIPDSVTSIGRSAFKGCSSLTGITIPDSVASIESSAFNGCRILTTIEVGAGNVNYTGVNGVLFNKEKTTLYTYPAGKTGANYTIPDGVTSIGYRAFSGCGSLTSITIPGGVTSIGGAAFAYCTSLTSITIPDSVTSIGNGAFSNCTSLTSITIPDGVTSIGLDAFFRCSSLTSITIPDSVTTIGGSAFWGCTSLTAVTFLGDAPQVVGLFRDATLTIYRKPEAKGWGETFDGRPVKLISEKP